MKDLAPNNDTQLPGLPANFFTQLARGIDESRAATTVSGSGKPFLRLLKDGTWVFGQNDEPVKDASQWLVNLQTLEHGYERWSGGEDGNKKPERVLCFMGNPKPARPQPLGGVPFEECRAFELKCISGKDFGTEVQYITSSKGGTRAVDELLKQIRNACAEHPQTAFPALMLGKDHYRHSEYGRIYTPVFEVVGWSSGGPGPGESVPDTAEPDHGPRAVGRTVPPPVTMNKADDYEDEDEQPVVRRRPGRPRGS